MCQVLYFQRQNSFFHNNNYYGILKVNIRLPDKNVYTFYTSISKYWTNVYLFVEMLLYRWLSNQRLYLKKMILILFLKMFTQPMRRIENLEFFKFEHSMECYKSVNKGRICTESLISE